MTIKIRLSTSTNPNGEDVSKITMDVERILFEGSRLILLRDGEVLAEFSINAVREIELSRRTYSIDKIRADRPKAYQAWTPEEEQRLSQLHGAGIPVNDIAKQLGRQPSGIKSRLKRLGLT
jgi:DNA-binding NarL/FixJ family response regulator